MTAHEIYLIRHTAVDVPLGTCYGRSDVPLAPEHAEDIERVREKLPPAMRVVTSPSLRCTTLANALTVGATPPGIDPRLRELDFGAWELQRWNDIGRDEIDEWRRDIERHAPPGGEPYCELARRAVRCLLESIEAHATPLFLVTHGGVVRALLAHALGIELTQALRLQIDYGGVSKVTYHREHSVVAYVNR
ncbi:MAG: alpha-ribazole phosphatase [Gammaproteobacteria bacterium]|nr:alpha-ribazole phosphatase [Gammaproteobacteria bacterium]